MLNRRFKLKRGSRSGVTLLFVVSMIVLFLLMGTAFVLVTNDYFRASRKRSTKHVFATDHDAMIERAFYDLLRGPELSNSSSPLRGHSLLADMYGYGFTATVQSAAADSSGHFISLQLASDTTQIIDDSGFTLPPIDGLLSGRVISVVSGSARGLSGRIIDHQVQRQAGSTTHQLILLPTKKDRSFDLASSGVIAGERVIVNGRPFAGTGAGHFNPNADRDSPALSDAALAPNQKGRSLQELIGRSGGNGYFSMGPPDGPSTPNSAGPNESYDTFDYQNMFLAGLMRDGTVVAPSFHRAAVAASPVGDFRAFERGGPADDGVRVDNNNDGIPEGIWVDAGLPVQTRPNGTCVKPLVSFTVIDMGGKLNVNAHGSLLRSASNRFDAIDLLSSEPASTGQGLGPPEIDLSNLLPSSSLSIMNGRYGPDGQPGEAGVRDVWSGYKLFGYPDAPFDQAVPGTVNGLFGSAMDIHGRFSVGYPKIFDVADDKFPIGMPVANVGFSTLDNEIVDSPYEMNFSNLIFGGPGNGGFDTPFEPAELEAVLRRRDPDSNLLPPRLLELGAFFGENSTAANSITTDSFEVPTTFDSLPELLYDILNSGKGNQGIPSTTPDRAQKIAQELNKLLPPEIFRGLPMNVNREFGDGLDNNNNNVTDEIGELDQITHPAGDDIRFDYDNDGVVDGDIDLSRSARINFARHLYVVTLMVTERIDRNGSGEVTPDDWYDFNADEVIDENDFIDYRRLIAQWAINVVDFRDPDSIMTGFEVDLNPFNGWDVDDDLDSVETIEETIAEGETPQDMREVFWGAERPELLITETMATHDRRTQDLSTEKVAQGEDAGHTFDGTDEDFDSNLVPNVSVFFELYNPWVMNDANQIRPAELYDSRLNGVDLQKTSLDGTSPVWRLVVTGNEQGDLDPDNSANNSNDESIDAVRRIYFSRPGFNVDTGPEIYFPEDDVDSAPVVPGRYAIVGTQGQKVADRYDTYFGRRTTPESLSADELQTKTRRISLDWKNSEIQLLRWDKSGAILEEVIRPAVALPIGLTDGGRPRQLGVSDPVRGYINLTGPGGEMIDTVEVEDGMKFVDQSTTLDFAFDQAVDQKIDEDHFNEFLIEDGLQPGYRTVHLQRLADPINPFNARTNPYRTIDSSSLDLFVFNGVGANEPQQDTGVLRFGSYERRGDFDTENGQEIGRHRLLFKNDTLGRVSADDKQDADGNETADVEDLDCEGLDSHFLSRNFAESFANVNDAYLQTQDREDDPDIEVPFCWLSWNNRPFASHLELVNVPHTSSYQMTRSFDISSGSSRVVYEPPLEEQEVTGARNYSAHFPHLLNFYADRTELGDYSTSLHRVLDYLEVPSRFVGTESHVNPTTFINSTHGVSFGLAAPFDTISSYRYPGKINLNTVLDPSVWNGLMGFYATESTDRVSFSDWVSSRDGSGVYNFANPLRPAKANNLVPPSAQAVVEPVDCGLFRRDSDSDSDPLLDYDPPTRIPHSDTQRAAYFRYDMRQRLGNLVTTRSSVFAVWITVGYFEVDSNGSLDTDPSAPGRGIEFGRDTGESIRRRGFFLVDRSIPVAFEPGKNHNVDRAVLVKTFIE